MSAAQEMQLPQYLFKRPLPYENYVIGAEPFKRIYGDLLPLIKHHQVVNDENLLKGDINVNMAEILDADNEGRLLAVTARRTDCALVGYFGVFIGPHFLQPNKLMAGFGLLYVRPEDQGNGISGAFVDYAADVLKEMGVSYMVIDDKSPIGGQDLGKLAKAKGFQPFSVTYLKHLED